MIIAFAGASGRTDATHASLLAAHAIAYTGGQATLLIPTDAPAQTSNRNLRIVRVPADAPAQAIAWASGQARIVIADLPSRWLRRNDIRARLDLAVLVVGPHETDECEAAAWKARTKSSAPIVYLGCGRAGGGPAVVRFAAAMAALDPGSRITPCVFPPLSRAEAAALFADAPRGRTLRMSMLLLAAVRQVAIQRNAGFVPLETGTANEVERAAITRDARRFADRLRDLADDVDAADAGLGPTAADLVDAPSLDQWEQDVVLAPILKGIVTGHPDIDDGRPARTTEVYLTDRATYARTLSRWYKLIGPAGSAVRALQ